MISLSAGYRLLKIKQNQIKMAHDRGFDISDEEELLNYDPNDEDMVQQFIDHFSSIAEPAKTTFRYALNSIYTDPEGKKMAVYYPTPLGTGDMGIGPICSIIADANKIDNLVSLIVIANVDLTSDAAKALSGIEVGDSRSSCEQPKTYYVQVFNDSNLMYNPKEHKWVPEYQALTQKEQQEFLQTNRLRPDQLPILKFTNLASQRIDKDRNQPIDPIVAYYGWLPNQIVKVIRRNFLTDTLVEHTVVYRRVSY